MAARAVASARARAACALGLSALLVLTGCSAPLQPQTASDKTSPPEIGACYLLEPKDGAEISNGDEAVPCTSKHTAQTFAIGTLPEETGKDRESTAHGRWIYPRCEKAFEKFLSVDESLALRVQLSWVWFRPSERGWDKGARWYRCDVVGGPASDGVADGGGADAAPYRPLPTTAQGLFRAKPPEQWLTCVRGDTVIGGTRVPCSEAHDWRAVTTIKLGQAEDPYPGDRLVQVRSRDFCSDSVGAWMNYPVDYGYGYTWFHEAEWKAGNRRSVCWAKTDQ